MLSTVVTVGSAVVLIAGVAYLFYQYFPLIVEFYNSTIDRVYYLASYLPDWLLPCVSVCILLSVIGLLVKLL